MSGMSTCIQSVDSAPGSEVTASRRPQVTPPWVSDTAHDSAVAIDTNSPASGARIRRAPFKPRMGSVAVVVGLEIQALDLQIRGRPEDRAIQAFAESCQ